MSKKKNTLNARQKKFVNFYLQTGNATTAAIRAGYSKKAAAQVGARLLRNAKVRAEIEKRQQKIADKADVTTTEIISGVRRVTMKAEAVGKYDASLRGFRLLAEYKGILTKRVEHTGADGGPIAYTNMTDAELEQMLQELDAEEDGGEEEESDE